MWDHTMALARKPYTFIRDEARRRGTNVFPTRLLLEKAICLTGREAAALFYDRERFTRVGAAPSLVRKTLFGEGGVQTLDGEAHRARKAMFMALMTPTHIRRLREITSHQFRQALGRWATRPEIVLHAEMAEVLCRSVCAWSGVPLKEAEVKERTRDVIAVIRGPAAIGPRHWRGRRSRRRSEKWLCGLIRNVRQGQLEVPPESALHRVAFHRDALGQSLDERTAAVELFNVIRPTVAIAWYLTFLAHALHSHPRVRAKLVEGEPGYHECVVQEVRRYYPFFPSVVARVRKDFDWRGVAFAKGRLTVLDLYGTNHDPRLWKEPEEFLPERFIGWKGDPFSFIPQGGGDHHENHRCPGEWITIEVMKLATEFLTTSFTYELPEQDLSIPLSQAPTLPRSGFRMKKIRALTAEPRVRRTG